MLNEAIGATFVIICALCIYGYYELRKKLYYWEKRGFHGPKPHIFFGHFKDAICAKVSYGERLRALYFETKHKPVVGCFMMNSPMLLINDPDYIEKILKTDFSSFTDRSPTKYNTRNHDLYADIFNLNGPKWKAMRNHMSPVFTSLKLKTMMPQMAHCFENTSNYIDENSGKAVDMKEVSAIFSHDIIVQCLFGIESKELSRPGTRFRRMQTQFFQMSIFKVLSYMISEHVPKLAEVLNLSYFPKTAVEYFRKVVEMTLNQRSKKINDRHDLIQVLLKLKQKKIIDIYDWEHSEDEGHPDPTHPIESIEITDEILESQAMIFFHTGIETLVSSLTLIVYELARSPQVLERLRQEIDTVVSKQGLNAKALSCMPYLDMCIKETLRIHPVVPMISRVCSRRYELPCGSMIEPGDVISVPIIGVHSDHEYYQDPLEFKPERFATDPAPFTYLPFGEGPRICFAMRFVQTELKTGLCKLIQRYDFNVSPKTQEPISFAKWSMFVKTSKPIWISFTRRQNRTEKTEHT